jgi:ferrous iron transport protein A
MGNGEDETRSEFTSLSNIDAGVRVRIAHIQGGRDLIRRLLSLGLREGIEVDVLQRRGRGVVVAHAGTRVAIGGGIAKKLDVCPLKQS